MQNIERDLAKTFILDTKRHVFLTGRAGSGKTTLVKEILDQTDKNCAVLAPTGVAAINAGGVTMHSFFQLPTTAFVPNSQAVNLDVFTNRPALRNHMKYNTEKRSLIQALDMLIIDEISMVRPDMLDTVDYILRSVRKNPQPFGDVQLLMVGDLYQLPPVVKNHEWEVLQEFYKGPYFFNAQVWQTAKLIPIELKIIYRQSNPQFVNILNNIREGKVTSGDLEILNMRHIEDYENEDEIITLTTHNASSNKINSEKLDALGSKKLKFKAKVDGKFSESSYPCAETMILKKGAQVMFIKNDKDKRYFNGRLAEVIGYDREEEEVKVKCKDDASVLYIQREEWENNSYSLNEKTNTVEKEKLGSFKQFPFRLAWAVTVHKSQGLTLKEVVLDLSRSFAAGQTYVGLSRCESLDGIVLTKPLIRRNVIIDQRITSFYSIFPETQEVAKQLDLAKKEYALFKLQNTFRFVDLSIKWEAWQEYAFDAKLPSHGQILNLIADIDVQLKTIEGTAQNFYQHLQLWIAQSHEQPELIDTIKEKSTKAIPWFVEILYDKCLTPMHHHLHVFQQKNKVKKYIQLTEDLYESIWRKVDNLYTLKLSGKFLFPKDNRKSRKDLGEWKLKNINHSKTGSTFEVTLALHREGLSPEEIAERRGMTIGTIMSHFTRWLKQGEIEIHDVMSEHRIELLKEALEGEDFERLGELKDRVGMEVTFDELRMMRVWMKTVD